MAYPFLTRPLGTLSDFIIERLPDLLAVEPESLPAIAVNLVSSLSNEQISSAIDNAPQLARLDAKILEAAIVCKTLTPPDCLSQLVETLSGTELPSLTYEEIILYNPDDDMRLFSVGEIGITEYNFYRTHQLIENGLKTAIEKIRQVTRQMSRGLTVEAAESAFGIENDLQPMVEMMCGLGKMNREHFAAFRPYLSSHPTRNLKGPSGAFSGRVPLTELLVRKTVPQHYLDYLQENLLYFPAEQRQDIAGFLEGSWRYGSLGQLLETTPNKDVQTMYDYILEVFDRFRKMHMGAVKRQVPEAFNGNAAGTAGELDVPAFLKHRIDTLKR